MFSMFGRFVALLSFNHPPLFYIHNFICCDFLVTVPLGSCCLQVAQSRFQPQLIVYNAGTDILDGDPLGNLNVLF